MVALPDLLPADDVSSPTARLVLLVAPGLSRLKLPVPVMPPEPEMLALRAAWGDVVAWLVTLTRPVGEVEPMRTLPRAMGLLLMTGEAWLTTLAEAWMVPATP